MIETTYDRRHQFTWPGPGESSEEAGRTPTVYTISSATHRWLETDSIRTRFLESICTLKRLIYPSHIVVADDHFMLTWAEQDTQPISVQLLIEEQFEAMIQNRIAATTNSTWTGERWVQDHSYIQQWAPHATLRRTHEKCYRAVLNYATLQLCTMQNTPFIPHATAVHIQHVRSLLDNGATSEEIQEVKEAHRRWARRQHHQLNKERRRNQPPSPATTGLFSPSKGAFGATNVRQVRIVDVRLHH